MTCYFTLFVLYSAFYVLQSLLIIEKSKCIVNRDFHKVFVLKKDVHKIYLSTSFMICSYRYLDKLLP